ncbi:MAG: type II secretion system F family protein, partial [Nocardioidaceae bacterium]
AGLLLVGGVAGMVVGAGVGVLCWRATAGLEPPAVRRRRERLEADLPLVVDLMASAMAAGAAPSAAVAAVASAVDGPTAEELAALHARLVLGADPVTAWRDLGADPQLGPLGRCVARAVESGASVADALHRLAEDLRASRRAEVEGRARSVGVKAAAPLGLCLLPAFVLTGVVPLVAASVRLFTGR